MQYKNYSEEKLIEAVANSTSIRQTLIKLNLAPQGGNYVTINRAVERLNLDTSHWKGKAWSAGLSLGRKRDISVYLNNEFKINSHALRLRLLSENILDRICSNCNLTHWLDELIPLELEHKDGNSSNNNLENLCLLCPNCHALTPTYRGKNAKKKVPSERFELSIP